VQTLDKRLVTQALMVEMGIPWYIDADSPTTFPARSDIVPVWWLGKVVYRSVDYADHPRPTDMEAGDVHMKRRTSVV
jgi:hypothetical protein